MLLRVLFFVDIVTVLVVKSSQLEAKHLVTACIKTWNKFVKFQNKESPFYFIV